MNFTNIYIFAQETAKAEDFIWKTPRLTLRQTNRCNIAAATNEEHFRQGLITLLSLSKQHLRAHKSIIGEFRYLISDDPTSAPTPQQIKSIQVLEKFYENDLTKS